VWNSDRAPTDNHRTRGTAALRDIEGARQQAQRLDVGLSIDPVRAPRLNSSPPNR
jgi:hypothetical protein